VNAFEKAHSGITVNVFRAPTAQLNARVAADTRSGGIRANVIWACDPLTMHQYDGQRLLKGWLPPNASAVPSAYRSAHFFGVDLLYMVIVVHRGTPAPTAWSDLAKPEYHGDVAMPSPTFAASALGLLGYLAATPGYGVDFYKKIKQNAAVQMDAPGDVLTAVEQGSYPIGVTLANAAYTDQAKGSPIEVVWPRPGGLAIYSPVAVTTRATNQAQAEQFAAFLASRAGQTLMAEQDTYVTLPGLDGPPIPKGSPTVSPDWPGLFDTYKTVLSQYTAIFGG
jgi:iron(III) transport system substrate-binding protein